MSKKDKIDFSNVAARVIKSPIEDFVETNFLPYAHYVIMNRALISDDGLKPVQRRSLYAMHKLGLTDKKEHMKAAQVVGETMGKYHPHGDASIADALGRMGQDFSMRVPLIDVQGSVGFKTGDSPAAPRYWEARPSKAAMELLSELDEGAIEIGENYDGRFEEPAMLPVRWPNGIINGSQGIAVGYSCNILPHNPTEVMDAVIATVNNPEITVDEILKIMPGPDMPTGGVLLGFEGVREYYETGKGTFIIRGEYEITPSNRGTHIITFKNAPYQISAEQIITAIDRGKKNQNRFKAISEVKDLTDGDKDFNLQIRVKSGANPNEVIQDLFRWTPLEQKFPANMNVLVNGVPHLSTMKELLQGFIDFREECIVNKVEYKLDAINKNISRIEGIIAVLVDIDKAIEIIRKSDDSNEASTKLQKQFKVTEEQADYVLAMPLRRLTKSDSISLQKEIEGLRAEQERLSLILSDDDVFKDYLIEDLKSTKEIIKDERRTIINNKSEEELKEEERKKKAEAKLVENNTECYVTIFADGTITKSLDVFKQDRSAIAVTNQIRTKTQENLILVANDGQGYRIPVSYIPLDTIIDLKTVTGVRGIVGGGNETIDNKGFGTLIVTTSGGVNIVDSGYPGSDDFLVTKLGEDEEVLTAIWLDKVDFDEKSIVTVSSDANALHFRVNEIRTSRAGAGTVRGMILDDGAAVVGASVTLPEESTIVSCTHTTIKVTDLNDVPGRKRAAKGVRLQRLSKDDEVINAFASDRVIANNNGRGMRLPDVSERALSGDPRSGTGVILGHHTVK